MPTSQDFDTLYSELANAAIANQRANARHRATIAGAEQQRDNKLSQSRATSDANRANANSILQNVQQAVTTGYSLLKQVRVSERDAAPVQNAVLDNISAQRHLERANQNAGSALQALRGTHERLIDIRRENDRKRRAQQRVISIAFGLISLLIVGGLVVFSNFSAQQAAQANQTATAAMLISLNQTATGAALMSLNLTTTAVSLTGLAEEAQRQMTLEYASSLTQVALTSPPKVQPTLTPPMFATTIASAITTIEVPTRTAIPSDAFDIKPGESRQMVLETGQLHRWTLTNSSVRRVSIQVTSQQFGRPDAYIEVYDLSGRLLASDDDSAGNLNPRITSLPVRANTEYIIVVGSRNNSSGAYVLSVDPLN